MQFQRKQFNDSPGLIGPLDGHASKYPMSDAKLYRERQRRNVQLGQTPAKAYYHNWTPVRNFQTPAPGTQMRIRPTDQQNMVTGASSTCPTCQVQYNLEANLPKVMPCCGATTCLFCLVLQEASQTGYIQCFNCNKQHLFIRGRDFNTNFTILEVFERLDPAKFQQSHPHGTIDGQVLLSPQQQQAYYMTPQKVAGAMFSPSLAPRASLISHAPPIPFQGYATTVKQPAAQARFDYQLNTAEALKAQQIQHNSQMKEVLNRFDSLQLSSAAKPGRATQQLPQNRCRREGCPNQRVQLAGSSYLAPYCSQYCHDLDQSGKLPFTINQDVIYREAARQRALTPTKAQQGQQQRQRPRTPINVHKRFRDDDLLQADEQILTARAQLFQPRHRSITPAKQRRPIDLARSGLFDSDDGGLAQGVDGLQLADGDVPVVGQPRGVQRVISDFSRGASPGRKNAAGANNTNMQDSQVYESAFDRFVAKQRQSTQMGGSAQGGEQASTGDQDMHNLYKQRAQAAFQRYHNQGQPYYFSSSAGPQSHFAQASHQQFASHPPSSYGQVNLYQQQHQQQQQQQQPPYLEVWHGPDDPLKCGNVVCHNRRYLIVDTGEYMPVCSRRCAAKMTFSI